MFNFEKLEVWKRAIEFADTVYAHSKANFTRFIEIASGSLFEVVSQASIGRNLGFLTEESFTALYFAAEEQSRMLSGLRKHLDSPH